MPQTSGGLLPQVTEQLKADVQHGLRALLATPATDPLLAYRNIVDDQIGLTCFELVEAFLQTLDGHDEVDAERGAAHPQIGLGLFRGEDLSAAQLAAASLGPCR